MSEKYGVSIGVSIGGREMASQGGMGEKYGVSNGVREMAREGGMGTKYGEFRDIEAKNKLGLTVVAIDKDKSRKRLERGEFGENKYTWKGKARYDREIQWYIGRYSESDIE